MLNKKVFLIMSKTVLLVGGKFYFRNWIYVYPFSHIRRNNVPEEIKNYIVMFKSLLWLRQKIDKLTIVHDKYSFRLKVKAENTKSWLLNAGTCC